MNLVHEVVVAVVDIGLGYTESARFLDAADGLSSRAERRFLVAAALAVASRAAYEGAIHRHDFALVHIGDRHDEGSSGRAEAAAAEGCIFQRMSDLIVIGVIDLEFGLGFTVTAELH